MDIELQNRVARRMLETLLAYYREFRETDTAIEPDVFGLTAGEFRMVANRLAEAGLARLSDDETCFVTSSGLALAADATRLDALFPVTGDPSAPLPSELELYGTRSIERATQIPPPMEWEEYRRHINLVWSRLLDSELQNNEAVFQRFLEKHPCLLPDSFGCFQRGATPHRLVYFAEPELPGFRAKKPDFMTITFDSEAVVALLIEIEAPAKRWAIKSGIQSAPLTQARSQIRDWKVWFEEPENRIQFAKTYQIDARLLETRQFLQRYVLVYGRRKEANANPIFAKRRALESKTDEVVMTYDRLSPSNAMAYSPTLGIKRTSTGERFSVIHVPPTFKLGTYNADQLFQYPGLREAIAKNELMSQERKDFLVQRCSYWEEWSRKTPTLSHDSFNEHYME